MSFPPRCHWTPGNRPVRCTWQTGTKDHCIENVGCKIIKIKTGCHCIVHIQQWNEKLTGPHAAWGWDMAALEREQQCFLAFLHCFYSQQRNTNVSILLHTSGQLPIVHDPQLVGSLSTSWICIPAHSVTQTSDAVWNENICWKYRWPVATDRLVRWTKLRCLEVQSWKLLLLVTPTEM